MSEPSSLFEPADFTIEGGFRAAKQLLGKPGGRPTAIFAASDEMAIGALHYYEHSNPVFFAQALRTLERLLES